MIYGKFLKDERILELLGELRNRGIQELDERIDSFEKELESDNDGFGISYPIDILEDSQTMKKNIHKILTNNNMITIILINYLEGKIELTTRTFGEVIHDLKREELADFLQFTIEQYDVNNLKSESKEVTQVSFASHETLLKTWVMVSDFQYSNTTFTKVMEMLPFNDLTIFLNQFSTIEHNEEYYNSILNIYVNYYPKFFEEYKDKKNLIYKKFNGAYKGVTPFTLSIYGGWRSYSPHKPFEEFIEYLLNFDYEYSLDYFRFINGKPSVIFEKFLEDEELGAIAYFQLFNCMVKKYGYEYYKYFHYDPYDFQNTAVTINFEDFKKNYIADAPMEWVVELCSPTPTTVDFNSVMFYED